MYITHNNKGLQGRQQPGDYFYTLLHNLILFNLDKAPFNSNVHLIFNIWPFL